MMRLASFDQLWNFMKFTHPHYKMYVFIQFGLSSLFNGRINKKWYIILFCIHFMTWYVLFFHVFQNNFSFFLASQLIRILSIIIIFMCHYSFNCIAYWSSFQTKRLFCAISYHNFEETIQLLIFQLFKFYGSWFWL